MNTLRRRRLLLIMFFLTLAALVLALVLYALRQNISLFYSPSDLMQHKQQLLQQRLRLGGMVAQGSVKRLGQGLSVEFALTDFKKTVLVRYEGILPDLFREGQGIVARGYLKSNGTFQALEVLAKHDANYMPPEVRTALKEARAEHAS